MQDPAEWGRATGGFSYESEGKWIEKFLPFGRSHGGRSASYDSAGATGSAQGWPSLGMRDLDAQISRRSYDAGAAPGSAWSGPMRSGYFHVERADRAFAGQGPPYGRSGASAGWKSRIFGLEPQQDRSYRARDGGAGWRRHISSGGSQPNDDMIAHNGFLGGSQPEWSSPDWARIGFRGSRPLPRSHPLGDQCGSDVDFATYSSPLWTRLIRRFVRASVRRAGSCCGCLFPLPTTAAYAH